MNGRIAGLDSLEGVGKPGDLVFGVLRRKRYSKAGLIFGDGRIANRRHEETFFFELRGNLKATGFGSQAVWHDGGRRRFGELQSIAQLAHSLPEAAVSFLADWGLDDLDSGGCGGGRWRRRRGGENEGSGLVDEEVDEGLGAADESSGDADSLP